MLEKSMTLVHGGSLCVCLSPCLNVSIFLFFCLPSPTLYTNRASVPDYVFKELSSRDPIFCQ